MPTEERAIGVDLSQQPTGGDTAAAVREALQTVENLALRATVVPAGYDFEAISTARLRDVIDQVRATFAVRDAADATEGES